MGWWTALALLAAAIFAGTAQAAPRLTATPPTSLVDATVHVRLTGAKAGEKVTLTANEGAWKSRAVFRADAHGVVDLARDHSTGGTYRGIDEMGLFWSMSTAHGKDKGWPGDGGSIRLRALASGRTIARTTIQRQLLAPGVSERTTTLARDGFVGRYYAPAHSNQTPILIFGGSGGGFVSPEPQLLASHGFPTLVIAYFGEPGLPKSLVRISLEYFVKAIRWLDRRPGVDSAKLAVFGISRGTEPALLLGADFPKLVHAVVALAPSSTVVPGLPRDGARVPAWTLGGKAIPIGSRIPVGRIRGPVFLAAGVEDALWHSYSSEQSIARSRMGKRTVTLVYPHAGHSISYGVPNVPLYTVVNSRYGTLNLGGSRPADAHARADLWPKLLRFLTHLT